MTLLAERVSNPELRFDLFQIIDVHDRSIVDATGSASRLRSSLARLPVEVNSNLSGPLKNMKELAEGKIEQREDNSDRVKLRKKAVMISAQKMSRGGQ